MNLKDYKIKGYSLDNFCAFAKFVGERLGISNNRDYKKHVDESCKGIEKALDEFRKSIPLNDEKERFKWQSSVHDAAGQYQQKVYNTYFDKIFIKSLKNLIKVYEEACVWLVMPPKVPKLRNIFKRIFSGDKRQSEITPSECDHVFVMLLQLKREAFEKAKTMFDEVCAHDDFKHLSVHMPQRFGGIETEWSKGEMHIDNKIYKLPTKDDRFGNIGASKNTIIDKDHECYYLRGKKDVLYKIDCNGNVDSVVSQGSFGEPLNKIIDRYKEFFGL